MRQRLPAPPVPALLAGAVFLLAAALALTPFDSHDLWWHLRTGELILRSGRVPTTNTYSFTAPHQAWVTHEWLSEVIFFWVYSRVGPAALVALKALLIGLAFAAVYWTAWRESESAWLAAAMAAIAAYAARLVFDIRPHAFTLLALALVLATLSHHRRRGGRLIYALVPLFWVWANLHSGFIVGLGVLALAAACTSPEQGPETKRRDAEEGEGAEKPSELPAQSPGARRRLLIALALSVMACVVTPNHWRGLWFPLEVSRTTLFTQTLTEWFSPDFHSPWLHGFEVLLLALVAALAISPLRVRAFDLILLVGLAHMALQHQRHAALFAIAAAPILARHTAPLVKPLGDALAVPARAERLAAAAMGLTAAVLLYGAFPRSDAFGTTVGRGSFPVAAAEHLLTRPPMRVYNSYIWGGYLIWAWRRHPGYRVFIDGRADAYPHQVFQDYLSIERVEPAWESLLNRYGVDIVLYHTGRPLSLMLRKDPAWKLAYADAVAEVFIRRSADAAGSGSDRVQR